MSTLKPDDRVHVETMSFDGVPHEYRGTVTKVEGRFCWVTEDGYEDAEPNQEWIRSCVKEERREAYVSIADNGVACCCCNAKKYVKCPIKSKSCSLMREVRK